MKARARQKCTAVNTLAEHCEFGALREELMWDRIVVGIRDAKLSESLQLDLDLEQSYHKKTEWKKKVLRGTKQVSAHIEAIQTKAHQDS